MRIVFVCSGNICRSPMAAEYFRHRAASQGLTDFEVDSAGTLGIHGSSASAEAIEAMAEIGVDLTGHRSQGLRANVLHEADYTIGMEQDHLENLARRHPEGEDERLLIRAFESGANPVSSPRDLEDPMGRDLDFYREQIPLLTRCIDHLIVHLEPEVIVAGGGATIGARTYARVIERRWAALQERSVILSPKEWALISDWYARSIPLQIVEEAMEAAAEKRADGRPPRTLTYVAPAVEESWAVVVDGRRSGIDEEPP